MMEPCSLSSTYSNEYCSHCLAVVNNNEEGDQCQFCSNRIDKASVDIQQVLPSNPNSQLVLSLTRIVNQSPTLSDISHHIEDNTIACTTKFDNPENKSVIKEEQEQQDSPRKVVEGANTTNFHSNNGADWEDSSLVLTSTNSEQISAAPSGDHHIIHVHSMPLAQYMEVVSTNGEETEESLLVPPGGVSETLAHLTEPDNVMNSSVCSDLTTSTDTLIQDEEDGDNACEHSSTHAASDHGDDVNDVQYSSPIVSAPISSFEQQSPPWNTHLAEFDTTGRTPCQPDSPPIIISPSNSYSGQPYSGCYEDGVNRRHGVKPLSRTPSPISDTIESGRDNTALDAAPIVITPNSCSTQPSEHDVINSPHSSCSMQKQLSNSHLLEVDTTDQDISQPSPEFQSPCSPKQQNHVYPAAHKGNCSIFNKLELTRNLVMEDYSETQPLNKKFLIQQETARMNMHSPLECPYCERCFECKYQLSGHMMGHVQTCEICDVVVQWDVFAQHMLDHFKTTTVEENAFRHMIEHIDLSESTVTYCSEPELVKDILHKDAVIAYSKPEFIKQRNTPEETVIASLEPLQKEFRAVHSVSLFGEGRVTRSFSYPGAMTRRLALVPKAPCSAAQVEFDLHPATSATVTRTKVSVSPTTSARSERLRTAVMTAGLPVASTSGVTKMSAIYRKVLTRLPKTSRHRRRLVNERLLRWQKNARRDMHCNLRCPYCRAKFISYMHFCLHLLTHVKGYSVKCKFCIAGFSTKKTLLNHVMRHIEGKRFHPYAYRNESTMPSSVHPHRCSTCGQCFKYEMQLLRHDLVHFQMCRVCMVTVRKDVFAQHMLLHRDPVSLSCNGERVSMHILEHIDLSECAVTCFSESQCIKGICEVTVQKHPCVQHKLNQSDTVTLTCVGESVAMHVLEHIDLSECTVTSKLVEDIPCEDAKIDHSNPEFFKQKYENRTVFENSEATCVKQMDPSKNIVTDNARYLPVKQGVHSKNNMRRFVKKALTAYLPPRMFIRSTKCSVCKIKFKTKRMLTRHMLVHSRHQNDLIHSSNHLPYRCQLCGAPFSLAIKLHSHVMSIHGEALYHFWADSYIA